MTSISLGSITFPTDKTQEIWTWDFVQATVNVRIYYKLGESRNFDFYAFERQSHDPEDEWGIHSTAGECWVWGHCHYDGLRHLYFGCKNTGNESYIYYPVVDDIVLVLRELQKLEAKHSDPD